MMSNKYFILLLLISGISISNSCNDCCRSRATTNCCTTSCCSPCNTCTTVSCTKNCCSTSTPSLPEPERINSQTPAPQPQIIYPVQTPNSKSSDSVTNSNTVNATSALNLNNTLSNVNTVHIPINITSVSTNNIKVDASGGSTSGGSFPQPITPQVIPSSSQTPRIIVLLVRQPPIYIPKPITIPTYIGIPNQNSCCNVQPSGCCSVQPQCSLQNCQMLCMSYC